MSIVRNTAGQAIPLGVMVDLTGAEVTDGAAATVSKDAGASASGSGTLSYAGGWWYAPTQAETDAAALLVRITKASAVPIGQAVITQDHARSAIGTIDSVLSGITSLPAWLRALARKSTPDSTAITEINTGGGGYAPATDSLEGIRDTEPLGTAMRGTDNGPTKAELDAGLAGITASVSEEQIGDIADAVAAAVDPWDSTANPVRTLTQTAAEIAAALDDTALTIHRGSTWSASITALGSMTGNTEVILAVKSDYAHTDAQAVLYLTRTGGLERVNGAVYATPAHGTLTVTDASAGNVTLAMDAAATAILPAGSYYYGIKWISASGAWEIAQGTLTVNREVVKATS